MKARRRIDAVAEMFFHGLVEAWAATGHLLAVQLAGKEVTEPMLRCGETIIRQERDRFALNRSGPIHNTVLTLTDRRLHYSGVDLKTQRLIWTLSLKLDRINFIVPLSEVRAEAESHFIWHRLKLTMNQNGTVLIRVKSQPGPRTWVRDIEEQAGLLEQ